MPFKTVIIVISLFYTLYAEAVQNEKISILEESVYVEAPIDTDHDGNLDRIYVSIERQSDKTDLPVIFTITPYATGLNNVQNHGVDVDLLPQDENLDLMQSLSPNGKWIQKNLEILKIKQNAVAKGYASVSAHSVGTGYSKGCPTIGDEAETLAAKAVIDWLNGRAKAFSSNGGEVLADWASGAVGMIGVSYNGTLPNMVATTGVEGLKAIIPISAISSWYDYYRANGLVVGPGGYIGEDADILGKAIVRPGTCQKELDLIAQSMGREHGDYDQFWQERDYVTKASQVRAAVFIIHGQSDWNVKERHAIQWWNALAGQVPLRMWLSNGGHGDINHPNFDDQQWAWFDRYVKGIENGVENQPKIEIQDEDGSWHAQKQWPHEKTVEKVFYLNSDNTLSEIPIQEARSSFIDMGRTTSLEDLIQNPEQSNHGRLAFLSKTLGSERILSGTTKVHLSMAVMNRKAANITVAIVDYNQEGEGEIVTRGWMDPQNYVSLSQGELLVPGREYQLSFDLEPKQHVFSRSSRIGIIVLATDYDFTLRPRAGTEISVGLGKTSYLKMHLSEGSTDDQI